MHPARNFPTADRTGAGKYPAKICRWREGLNQEPEINSQAYRTTD